MSYSQNVERQISRSRANTNRQINQNLESARTEGQAGIRQAGQIANSLSQFSATLQKQALIKKEENLVKGKQQARADKEADAVKLAALQQELATVKEQDTRFKEIQNEILAIGGEEAFPDAARIGNLSPWAQVGYAKEKIRAFNETFPDKLAHSMANSEQPITVGGFNFTPKQLKDNNINEITFKRASVDVLSKQIKEAAGMDKFSPELLALTKTGDQVQNAKDNEMDKHRANYNISSSFNTRQKLYKEWQSSPKTGDDLYRLHLGYSATVDKNNNPLGNLGGWSETMSALTSEGIASGDPYYADKIGAQEIPPAMASRLGIKQGKTFAQHWPGRFKKLKSDIKSGKVEANNAELKYQKTAGTQLTAQFIERARKGDLTTDQVNQYKRKFGELGLAIPSEISNYETVSMRDQREDEQSIKALMASQNGYISNEQLDGFHPQAALEHREKATKMEKAALKEFDADKKIKAYLDTAFTNMGIKANEKSPAYVEAMANAKVDYARQYNKYIAIGYSAEHASHLALHGAPGEAKNEDGEPIPGSIGVLTEIKQNGENSKYVITGQSIEKDIKPGHIRVARIASGKREMLDDPSLIQKGVIGGDYGHRQLTSIKNNLEKYGDRGLRMDKGALQYYQGLARGRNPREGGWWGLLDAQLKATGHPGLNPATQPPSVAAMTGKGPDGRNLPDPLGLEILRRKLSRAMQFPSRKNNQYVRNTAYDGFNNNGTSVYDKPENLAPHLR